LSIRRKGFQPPIVEKRKKGRKRERREEEERVRERIPTFNSERQILTGLLWRNQEECNAETESPGSTLNLMHHELGID
jgi:hypothetical protein